MQVNANIGTCFKLASWLRLSMSTINTTVKGHEEIKRRYVQCGPLR
jgi:hypothetical protein